MSTTSREVLAEFLGTLVLIVFGVGVVAQVKLGGGSNGQYLSINIAWGLAVMMGVTCREACRADISIRR